MRFDIWIGNSLGSKTEIILKEVTDMKRHLLSMMIITALAAQASASIFQDNSGLDADNVLSSPWSHSSSEPGTADNIGTAGWYGSNTTLHVHKAPYGADNGTTAAPGFVGVYRGNHTDVSVWADFTFVAPGAITQQMWQAKNTINRFGTEDVPTSGENNWNNSGRLRFSVSVNNDAFQEVDVSGWFGHEQHGADYIVGVGNGPNGYDGPLSNLYTTDLSALNIQSGDDVIYRFTYAQVDNLAGTNARGIGMGVQLLIPEPGTFMLFGLGGLLLYLKRRRT
ncbi:MAG: PEP-CTERM sorting domain-containing protein [Verrucomicrobia bacterium]|nr:PEP-CTERM sorting domain-containing protein [Verrucomicrobiota bacterium]MCH8510938.1 PEP-CTERM sorting domain-containing protein [Kiritimatiellia bacterium]